MQDSGKSKSIKLIKKVTDNDAHLIAQKIHDITQISGLEDMQIAAITGKTIHIAPENSSPEQASVALIKHYEKIIKSQQKLINILLAEKEGRKQK